MIINRIIDEEKISEQLHFGHLYFIYSHKRGIQEAIFKQDKQRNIKVSFINSFFSKAIKVSPYINKYGIEQNNINLFKERFGIDYAYNGEFELLNQVQYIALKELLNKNVIVIEVTGLSHASIVKLTEFFLNFLTKNKGKIMVIIVPEFLGQKQPFFKMLEIDHDNINKI